jgi:hypothetical protein
MSRCKLRLSVGVRPCGSVQARSGHVPLGGLQLGGTTDQ